MLTICFSRISAIYKASDKIINVQTWHWHANLHFKMRNAFICKFLMSIIRKQRRREKDSRSSHYLRSEYTKRLVQDPLHYLLQIQVHELAPEEEAVKATIYNSAELWDGAHHPWLDLATVSVTATLPQSIMEGTKMNVNNLPGVLSFPKATSVHDPNSLAMLLAELCESLQSRRVKELPGQAQSLTSDWYNVRVNAVTTQSLKWILTITGKLLSLQANYCHCR